MRIPDKESGLSRLARNFRGNPKQRVKLRKVFSQTGLDDASGLAAFMNVRTPLAKARGLKPAHRTHGRCTIPGRVEQHAGYERCSVCEDSGLSVTKRRRRVGRQALPSNVRRLLRIRVIPFDHRRREESPAASTCTIECERGEDENNALNWGERVVVLGAVLEHVSPE